MDGQANEAGQDPLDFDAGRVAAARKVVVCIPGALTRAEMFAPVQAWQALGYAPVYYRFPGLDGRAIHPKLRIEAAAAHIAAFCARYPAKSFRLFGYSTGGPIAISAAERMAGDVRAAVLASAVEKAGGLATISRITADVLAAAARVRSVRRRVVWEEYFKILLFGRAAARDRALADRADNLLKAFMADMVYPTPDLLAAHADDLRRWYLPDRPRLAADRLAFFTGEADPVFSRQQTETFADRFGRPAMTWYPDQGHVPFLTHPVLFDDVLRYFEASAG